MWVKHGLLVNSFDWKVVEPLKKHVRAVRRLLKLKDCEHIHSHAANSKEILCSLIFFAICFGVLQWDFEQISGVTLLDLTPLLQLNRKYFFL